VEIDMESLARRLIVLAILILGTACQDRPIPDGWLGRWTGPEGTYLELAKSGDRYEIKIQSLDGPATYEGVAVSGHIEFQRDGRTETIRAGNGKDTGMKWLLEKNDCLVIKAGEGFCRCARSGTDLVL
jgi:hypothetical protein